MQIQNISQLYQNTGYASADDSTSIVPLSDLLAAAVEDGPDVQLPDETAAPPLRVISPNSPGIADLFDWLKSNIENMTDNPKFVSEFITKIQQLRGEDGKSLYYTFRNACDVGVTVKGMLVEANPDGISEQELDDFFGRFNAAAFGVELFRQSTIKNIFFPDENLQWTEEVSW